MRTDIDEKWRRQFQEKTDSFEKHAPEVSWEKLDKALAARRHRNIIMVWGKRIAATAAMTIATIGIGHLAIQALYEPADTHPSAYSAKTQPRGEGGEKQTMQTDLLAERETYGTEETHQVISAIRKEGREKKDIILAEERRIKENINAETTEMLSEKHGEGTREVPNTGKEAEKVRRGDDRNSEDQSTTTGKDFRQTTNGFIDFSDIKRKDPSRNEGRLMAAVYMNTTAAADNKKAGGNGMQSSATARLPYGPVAEEFTHGSLEMLEKSEPRKAEYHHDFPIKIGGGMSYGLGNSWSVTTGLTYSRLRSTYHYSVGQESGTGRQTLHYLGIPLGIRYNIIDGNGIKLYAIMGGEMQKLVYGKSSEVANGADNRKEKREREKGWQSSINAAIGLEYLLASGIGLYAEPGISHYFKNGSHIENYYKDKPTNVSLNIGIRLNVGE